MKYLFLVLVSFSTGLNAQIHFNKMYDFGYSEWSYNVILNHSGEYVCLGGSKNFPDNGNGLLVRYNTLGNIMDSLRVIKPDLNLVPGWKGSIVQQPDNQNYYTVGYAQWLDSTVVGGVRSQALTMRFLPSGDTVYCKTWGDTNEYFWINTIAPCSDTDFLIGGAVRHDIGVLASNDFYFSRIDTIGTLLWEKRISTTYNDYMLNFFHDKKSKKIYAAGGRFINPIDDFSKPHFKVLDDSANLIFSKEWTDSAYSDGAIVFDRKLSDPLRPDQLLVVCGIDTVIYYSNGWAQAYYNLATIAGVDSNFNIIWRKTTNNPIDEKTEWYHAKALKNGRIIVVGWKQSPWWSSSGQFYGWAMLMDDYGNTIWDRTYHNRTDALQYFSDVQECPDGGFIFTGTVGNTMLYPNSDAWLVKVDSMGCEVPNCTPMSVEDPVSVKKDYSIYPNPSNGQLFILSKGDNFEPGMQVSIFDMIGQLVYQSPLTAGKQKVEIQLQNYLHGNYLLKLHKNDVEVFKDKITIIN